MRCVASLWMALALLPASALGLTTAYVSFEHPEGWQCELSQGVWICQSTLPTDRKEAVVLSIAAQATDWDGLQNYEAYLKKPRRIQDDEGKTITSQITYTRRRAINGHEWIDSLQKDSELPGFWTRYLATVHQTKASRLAILITYIVSEARYSKLAPQFERMVSSLKPKADFDNAIASKQEQILPGSQVLGNMQRTIMDRLGAPKTAQADAPPPAGDNTLILLALVVGVVAVLVFMRSRRKKIARGPSGLPGMPRGPQAGPPAKREKPTGTEPMA